MDEKLTVSVIIATYNRGYIISRAIESVINQKFCDWELLVVDDCSEDNTKEIVCKYDEPRIKYFRNPKRSGACYSRNVGMKHASGDYFCFLDSDCAWDDNYLSDRINAAYSSCADLVFGRMEHINGDNRTVWPYDETKDLNNIDYVTKRLVYTNLIDTNTVMMKRICWEQEGGFDVSFLRLQDWEYFSRILHSEQYMVYFRDNALVKNYFQKDSISTSQKWGVWRMKVFEKQIAFCRKKGILKQAVMALYFNTGDFEGCNDYQRQICSLLTKEELCDLVLQFGEVINEKEGTISKLEEAVRSRDTSIAELDLVRRKNVLIKRAMHEWLMDEHRNLRLDSYLKERRVRTIAIFGFGVLGKLLYEYISNTDIRVDCIIDRNSKCITAPSACKMISDTELNSVSLKADAIVVTAIMDYGEIENELKSKLCDIQIFSLENLIHELG